MTSTVPAHHAKTATCSNVTSLGWDQVLIVQIVPRAANDVEHNTTTRVAHIAAAQPLSITNHMYSKRSTGDYSSGAMCSSRRDGKVRE
jgi:hypothetical protein